MRLPIIRGGFDEEMWRVWRTCFNIMTRPRYWGKRVYEVGG